MSTSNFQYQAFGFNLLSDILLPELSKKLLIANEQNSISVVSGNYGNWPSIEASPHSTQCLQLAANEWRLALECIGWFRAAAGESLEYQRWDDSVSNRDLRTFLVTSGLGALAIQRACLVLHGTALERNGEAVLLLGRPATGKSTLSWCLQQHGWQLISSEIVVVDKNMKIWPGVQQLKLWHDAAVALDLNWQHLPLVRRGLKRYALLGDQLNCLESAAPLRCIYQLMRERQQIKSEADVLASSIKSSQAFSQQHALLVLRNNAFHARVVRGMECEQQLFMQASALARSVPIYSLRVPDGIRAMKNACAMVDLLDPASIQEPNIEEGTKGESDA